MSRDNYIRLHYKTIYSGQSKKKLQGPLWSNYASKTATNCKHKNIQSIRT